MGTTADKITKAILAHERSGVIDLSSYRAAKVAVEDARLGDDRLRERKLSLRRAFDPRSAWPSHILEKAIHAGTRNTPRARDPRQAIRTRRGGRDRLAHRLDLL